MMTPVKWYILYVTGSLNRSNTYVRSYVENSEAHVVRAMTCINTNPMSCLLAVASDTSIPPKAKKKNIFRSKAKKLAKTKAKIETDPPSPGITIDLPKITDSPQMLEFFAEVRQRELKAYYRQMKAAERCPRVPATRTKFELASKKYILHDEVNSKY